MSDTVIKVENISKFYQLGLINHGTLAKDLQAWWAKIRGKEDPNSRISLGSNENTNSDTDFIYALKDVSFDVKQGEVLGIIGANGAGKSTLLKILSRVTSPTSGCIKIKGRIGSLLEVGTGFHPELTGRENIYLNGAILGMRKHEIDRKLDEIIDFSGVEKFIDTPVKRYSSGMYVRLAFAVAAHLDPEILVVDEVLAVGDADFQKKALGKMQDASKGEGRTVLFVSHNMAAVKRLCKRGIVLNNGLVYYDSTINEAVDKYLQVGIEEYTSVPIADMPRLGSCSNEIRFEDVRYLNEKNEPILPYCGGFVRISIKIKVKEDRDGCAFSIGVYDSLGVQMMTLPTYAIMDDFRLSGGFHYICCDIPRLPLTVGNYRLGLWAGVHKLKADQIDSLIPLDVQDNDFFKKGRNTTPGANGRVVLCDYDWKINTE